MVRSALVVFLSLCCSLSLFAGFSQTQDFRPATPEELALKDVPFAPGAAAVILDRVEVGDDHRSVASEYYRIKILTEEGRKYADVEVPYVAGHPVLGRVTDISARTIQPDGRIVPFDGKVHDKVLLKGGGLRLRAKTFTLADVQPGSIIEYRYQRRWAELMLLPTVWDAQREIPTLRARFALTPYDSRGEFSSFFTYNNLPPGKVPVRVAKKAYELELTDIPPFQEEEFAPPAESLTARVHFYYTYSRVDPRTFWTTEATGWNKSIEAYVSNAGKLDARVQPLERDDPMETVRNLYAHVQAFRNLSYDQTVSGDEKKNAGAVISSAEGYRNEITRAFVALVRAAGLQANVVRVSTRDDSFFSQNIPDAEQMSDEIAVVTIDGKPLHLDPGTPAAPFGVVSWERSGVPGIVIAKGPARQIEMVAHQGPEQAVTRRTAELRLEGDIVEGTVTATFEGQEALRRRLRTWGEDESVRTKDLEDEAKQWFPTGAEVKVVEVKGTSSHVEPLVVRYDVKLPNLVSAAGSRVVLPISVFASAAKNPFAPATRKHAIYFPFRRQEFDVVKLTLPEGMTLAAVPPPADLNAGALQYSNDVRQDGSVVTFNRRVVVDAVYVDAEHYRGLRTFFSSKVAADQKPIVLVSK